MPCDAGSQTFSTSRATASSAEQAAHDAATTEFSRRVTEIVEQSAATASPVTHQQAALIVSRSDTALYGQMKAALTHT